MTKTTLNVLFKKIQKDDKKEVLKFEYKGKDKEESDKGVQAPVSLYGLSGEMVNLKVGETSWVTAEFSSLNKDSKKVTLDFALKGDSEDKALELYKVAGYNVQITIEPSQADLTEELPAAKDEKPHQGIDYEVDLTTGQATAKSKLEEQPKKEGSQEINEEVKKAEPEQVINDPDALPDDDLPF